MLFASSSKLAKRRDAKLHRVRTLAVSNTCTLLQETRGNEGDLEVLRAGLPGIRLWGSFADENAGGVAIILQASFADKFEWEVKEVLAGRILTIIGRSTKGMISFTSVHILPGISHRDLGETLRALRVALPHSRGCTNIIGGDFNFPTEGEGRYDAVTGRISVPKARAGALFASTFADMTELYQQDYTHRSEKDEALQILSRIDRIYCSMATPLLMDLRPSVGTRGMLAKKGLSDHLPVRACLSHPPQSAQSTRISAWLSRTPESAKKLEEDIRCQAIGPF